jgi:hypothetical protein
MMGGCTGFHAHQTSRLLRKKRQQPASRQSAPDDDRPAGINTMYLEYRLPNPIVTADSWLSSILPPLTGWRGGEEPSTASIVDMGY